VSLVVLAIDPGSTNHGLAVITFGPDDQEEILVREIVTAVELEPRLLSLAELYHPDITAIGSGTSSKLAAKSAANAGLQDIRIVDERNTTIEARYRYLSETPAPWYMRLIPKSLRLPSTHCDDWAAVILAERMGRG